MSEPTDATDAKASAESKAEETKQEQGFTQTDVDRIVRERVQRERAKYADYDDLKAKAGEATTAEERIAKLEQEIQRSQQEALRRRVQASHGITDEDADLFLTATDEDTLTAQAKRLAGREAERKQNGNVVPPEGNSPSSGNDGDDRAFVRQLFSQAE